MNREAEASLGDDGREEWLEARSEAARLEELLAYDLLRPGELAWIFGISPVKTARWAAANQVGSIRTPGGHRRYRTADVVRLLRMLRWEGYY